MKRLKTLTDVRKEMLTGHPFDITYCTFDEKRGTGGDRVSIRKALLFATPEEKKEMTPAPQAAAGERQVKFKKNPNHSAHNTFNIRLQNTDVKKVHWLLIEEFNNHKVVM